MTDRSDGQDWNSVSSIENGCQMARFMSAAKTDDVNVIQSFILDQVIDINVEDNEGNTALMLAAKNGSTDCICCLISDSRICINKQDEHGRTALMLAAIYGQSESISRILQIHKNRDLLVNPNLQDNNGMTALMLAARFGRDRCVQSLIRHSNLNLCCFDGKTALMWAAVNGHSNCLKWLIDSENLENNQCQSNLSNYMHIQTHVPCNRLIHYAERETLDEFDDDGNTALMLASSNGHAECVKHILATERVGINKRNRLKKTALMLAAEHGHCQCLRLLINTKRADLNWQDEFGTTALMLAVEKKRIECVECLIYTVGVSVDKMNHALNTAFMIAASKGNVEYIRIFINSRGLTRLDINKQNRFGKTALMLAACNGHFECVEYLLSIEDIDINMRDMDENTVLMLASMHGKHKCVKCLIMRDRTLVNVQDAEGKTALIHAAMNRCIKCIECLIDVSILDIQDRDGNTALMVASVCGYTDCVKCLIDTNKVDMAKQDKEGNTALMLATKENYSDCVKYLLSTNKGSINSQNKDGKTALMIAVMNNHLECVKYLIDAFEIDINKQDNHGNTALMLAAMNGYAKCVSYLLEKETINVQIPDKKGRTAFMLAAMNGKIQCLRSFLDIKVAGEIQIESLCLEQNKERDNLSPVFINRYPVTCYRYNSDIIWRRPYIYGRGQEEKSVLNMVLGKGLAQCVSCFLLGQIDESISEMFRCPCDMLRNIVVGDCDLDGNTAVLLASLYGHSDCQEYLLQFERIRFHALVIRIRQDLIETKSIPLVLYKKLCCFIRGYRQVDGFLQMVSNGSHIGQCVDFLLSAFICRTNKFNQSAFSQAVLNKDRGCFTLLAEFLTEQIPHNETVYNITGSSFMTEANKVKYNKLNFLSAFLQCDIFHWTWYPLFPHKKQRFLARELVINGYTPQQFEWKGINCSPLSHAFRINDIGLLRYLLTNLYLTSRDLEHLQRDTKLRDHIRLKGSPEIQQLHGQLYGMPWRLETLSLLKVSSLLKDKRRKVNMKSLDNIPDVLISTLTFMKPIRWLCVRQWEQILDNFITSSQQFILGRENLSRGKCCNGACIRIQQIR